MRGFARTMAFLGLFMMVSGLQIEEVWFTISGAIIMAIGSQLGWKD